MAREIKNQMLRDKLNSGLIEAVEKFSAGNHKLSLQVRDGYLNIYYRGGNILRVRPKSFEFDPFYFHTEDERSKKEVMKDGKRVGEYKRNCAKLTARCYNGEYRQFFEEAAAQMDKWLAKHPKSEREEQHQLIIANSSNDSQYYILDIEFAVSKESKYYSSKYKAPRFDIIAIDNSGQLWIFELKKGKGATSGGSSDCASHLEKYKATLGGKNCGDFVDEMINLLENKLDLKVISNINRQILKTEPIFAFLFEKKAGENYSLADFKKLTNKECPNTAVFEIRNSIIVKS